MIETSLFPYSNFGVRLEQKEENRIAWFKDDYDLQKHIDRYKLDRRKIKILYRDDEQPIQSSKTNKRKLESKSESKSNRSSGSVRKRKSSVDATRNTSRNSKSKS